MIKKTLIFVFVSLIAVLSLWKPISIYAKVEKPSNVVYEEVGDAEYIYFGKWNGNTWAIEGQLNYAIPQLSEIEYFVKLGDYANAKAALLKYYTNRESLRGLDIGNASNEELDTATLMCRDIVVATNAYQYIRSVEVPVNDKWNVFDVSGYVTLGQAETFTFIAGGKQDNIVTFDSKEGANKAYLELQLNGQKEVILPYMDTYIRAGKYETMNYGREGILEINDTGFPYDDDTRRTTMIFDLSGYKGTVSGAKIYLYGSSEKETCEVMVFNTNNTAWNETELTWKTETSGIFSWETSEEGTDWRSPASGAMNQFQETIGGLGLITTVIKAHRRTQNQMFAQKAHDLLIDFIKDCGENFNFPDSLRLGQRQRGFPSMVNYLLKTSVFTPDTFFRMMYFMYLQNDFLGDPLLEYPKYTDVHANASFVTTSNWGVIQNNGFFLGTYFMPELKKFSTWAELTQNRIVQLVEMLINDDGSYVEDNTSYPIATLGSYTAAINFASANNIVLSDRVKEKMREWAMWIVDFSFPNGYCASYGDSGYVQSRASVLQIGRILNDPELIYFGSGGSQGTAPAHTSAIYPDNITGMLRNGWGSNSIFMHINTFNGTHCHTDVNGIILYAYGQVLVPDSGTKSYDKADPISNWQLTSNEAHSTVRVDGSDPDRGGTYYNELVNWQTNDRFDVYQGYTEMYSDAPSTRTVLMVKPGFYIVSDYVVNEKNASRQYEVNWHLMPNSNPVIDPITKKASSSFVSGANIQFIPDDHDLNAKIFDGYITGLGGVTQVNQNIKYTLNSENNFQLNTVLYPTYEGQTKNVNSSRLVTNALDTSAMKILFDATLNNHTAYYGIQNKYNGQSFITTDGSIVYDSNAMIYYHELDTNNETTSIIISKGSKLSRNGRSIIDSPVVLTQFACDFVGNTLVLTGDIVPCTDKTKSIKIYAPNVSECSINGVKSEFLRDGDYIYAATSSASSEASRMEGLIDSLGSLDDLTKDDKQKIIDIKNEIRLYELKGMDISIIKNYGKIAESEFRVQTLISLADFQVRINFLPSLDKLELAHVEQVRSLRQMLEQLIVDTGDDPKVFKEYSDLLTEYEKVTSTFYDRVGMHLVSDSIDDYTISYNGKDYWWYYYQVSKTGSYGDFGKTYESTAIPGACWGSTVNGVAQNNPRNASDYQVPQTDAYPVKVWKAPCAGAVKVKFVVGAYYNMTGGNGVTCVGSINEMPFVLSEDGNSLIRNPNACFVQQVDALDPSNPEIVYYTYETVVYLEEGGFIALGSDPNGLSAYDHVYVRMNVEFLTNIKTTSKNVFDSYSDLISRLEQLPKPNEISLDNREEVEKLTMDINEFGREKMPNIEKLDQILEALDNLINKGYVIQTFVNGEGSVELSKNEAKEGEIVSMVFKPAQGYKYKEGSLTINGEAYDSLTFFMPASYTTISCTFEKIKYAITVDKYENSILSLSSHEAAAGENVFFSIIPDYGYQVDYDSLKMNGEKIDGNSFVMPMGEAQITYDLIKLSTKKGCKSSIASNLVVITSVLLATLVLIFLKNKKEKKMNKSLIMSFLFVMIFVLSLTGCKKTSYVIEYEPNGGILSVETRDINTENGFYLDVPRMENATFIGWFDSQDEDAKQITDKSGKAVDGYALNTNLVVFAKWEYWETSGLNYELNGTKDGYCLVGGDSSLTKIYVPEQYMGLPVVRVNSYAFYEFKNLKEIKLPKTVTSIGAQAFAECEKLESVTLSDEVTFIDKFAFQNCGNLMFINVPSKLEEISEFAFSGCSSLYEMDFSKIDNELEILEGAFKGCSVLSKVTLNSKIKKIDIGVFSGCGALTSFDTGSSVEQIEENAFSNSGLRELIIGENVTSIGPNFTNGCGNLKTIKVNEKNPSYVSVDDVLYNKDKTTLIRFAPQKSDVNYKIESSVTLILQSSFDGSYYLKNLEIGQNVEEIEFASFTSLNALSSIKIPYIGGTQNYNNYFAYIFGGEVESTNTNIPYTLTDVEIAEGIQTIPAYAFQYCANIKNVNIPETVLNIGASAFYGCSNLKNVSLPLSLESVGEMAYYACMRLESFAIDEANENYTVMDGVLFSKDLKTLVQYPAAKEDKTYSIPDTVELISKGAFYNNSNIESVVLPQSLKTIDDYAFGLCNKLSTINLGESNVLKIGNQCFTSCRSLIAITLPESLTSIGTQCFDGCNKLEKIYVKTSSVPSTNKMVLTNTPESLKIVFESEEMLNKFKKNSAWSSYQDQFFLED